jgi:putative two-component system response regulator
MLSGDFATISHGRSNAEYKAALARVTAELRRRITETASNDHVEFFLSALKSYSAIRGVGHLSLRLEGLNDCAVFFYLNNRASEAFQATSALICLARMSSDKDWMRKAYHLHGIVLAESGRVAEAVIAYAVALETARSLGNLVGEGKTLINLGVAFNYGAFYKEAIPCFRKALETFERASDQDSRHETCAALSNLAQSYFFLGKCAEGYEFVKEAILRSQVVTEVFAAAGLAVRQYTAFRLAVELGDMTAAKQHLDECVRRSEVGGTLRSQFVAQLAQGLYEIHTGDTEHGFALLTAALQRSRNSGSFYEEALAALVRAYDRVGEPELALEHMQALLAHLTKLRQEAVRVTQPSDGTLDASDLMPLRLQESELRTKVALHSAMRNQIELFERLAVTADLKEEASGEHGYRVGRLSALIAAALGWSKTQCHSIDLAARLHDLGKIAIPDRILLTSQELKEAERHLMSNHTLVGAELLAKSNIPQLQLAEEIAKFHHEWWNGEGYPAKRREKRIPIHARIVAIADVFDALTHGRPYAEPWDVQRALEEIRLRRGTQFDPELVDIFLEVIARLRVEHEDLDNYLGKAGKTSPFLQARNKIRMMLAEPANGTPVLPGKAPETVH